MSRTRQKRGKRTPGKLRRLEWRAARRAQRQAGREQFVAAYMLAEASRIAAYDRQGSLEGLVVCEKCGLVQPQAHAEADDGESNVSPCLRGVLLGLECDGTTAITLEHYAEAA